MGLYPQPNKWSCGPFALKYALIMLGKIVDEKDVSRIAGTHWWAGTDEIKLGRAARAYNCDLRIVRRTSSLRAKREIQLALKKGYPCLLCVDGWEHWITVVGAERGKFISVDSREAPVVLIDTWPMLEKRWVYKEADEDDSTQEKRLYDLHTVVPRFRMRTRARLSLKRARYLRRPENRAFATHWDEYFNDITTICTPRTPLSEKVMTMGEFLRRHGSMLKSEIAHWHGSVSPEQIGRILGNLKFIAETYDLVIREESEKHAIVAISANLALWTASKYGVNEIYGNE